MKGPPGAAAVSASAFASASASAFAIVRLATIVALVHGLGERSALAQSDPRFAIDPLATSERGSEWFANESLDLRGHLRPSLGYVVSFAHLQYVVPNADGSGDRAPVKDLAFLHVGGSLVLWSRVRVAFDLPFQLYAGGETAFDPGAGRGITVPAPPKEGGFGDLRLGTDVRLFGDRRSAVTGALGVQLWVPTGQRSQWASDGTFRVQPRAMLSGQLGYFVWAAQLGVAARSSSELTAAAAAGVRIAKLFVVGPELTTSTQLGDAFRERATPIEAIFGGHWLLERTARVGLGLGRGLNDGIGAPAWRGLFALEWSPAIPVVPNVRVRGPGDPGYEAPSDQDHDGVPDLLDACPNEVGIATADPKTNGCPPDSDGDGVSDLADACPTVPGLVTSDPTTNGCPDRDRDKDGVTNDVDACPDDAGPADLDARRSGCPKAFVHGERIELLDQVEWKSNRAELTNTLENEAILTAVLAVMLKQPETRSLRIEGHTDNRGDGTASKKLGAARAAAVGNWLVEHGIDGARIATEGIGAERPLATNETELGRAENRRIELHLVP